jgi:hypothetical protein
MKIPVLLSCTHSVLSKLSPPSITILFLVHEFQIWDTVIPAMWEAEMRGSQSKTGLGKSMRPHPKNKLKQNGLKEWFQW